MRPSLLLLCCALPFAACSTLPEVTSDVCGNHVLERDEECDTGKPGCSAPDAGVLGCRHSCLGGVACPTGKSCGTDGICRQATGGYTLSPFIGGAGDTFGLIDIDGDGALDLVDRGAASLAIFRNDTAGRYSAYASGAIPSIAFSAVGAGVAITHPSSEPLPLVAAITTNTVALFNLSRQTGAITPLVFPTNIIPPDADGKPRIFKGAIVPRDFDPAFSIFFDAAAKELVVYETSFGTEMTSARVAGIDLTKCGPITIEPQVTIVTKKRFASTMVVVVDPQYACVIIPNDRTDYNVIPLAFPTMTNTYNAPFLLADIDGDTRLDAVTLVDNGFEKPTVIVWSQLNLQTFDTPLIVESGYDSADFSRIRAFAAGDFDGDKLDDLLIGQGIAFDNFGGPTPFFAPEGPPYDRIETGLPIPAGQFKLLPAAGDINADSKMDAVITVSTTGSMALCLGEGTGIRFTCQVTATPLPGIEDLVLADVNGDLTTDVVVSSSGANLATPPRDGGVIDRTPDGGTQNESGLSVILGRPFGLPDPTPVNVIAHHSAVVGLARSPSEGTRVADGVIAALRTPDGRVGTSLGRGSTGGQLVFGFEAVATDVRYTDFDGDKIPDLALVNERGDFSLLKGTAAGGFTGGLPVSVSYFPSFRFVTVPDDPLPALGWISDENNVIKLSVAHYKNGDYKTVHTVDLPQDGMSPYYLDQFVVVDLDNDGRNEIVVIMSRSPDNFEEPGLEAQFVVVRFPMGGGQPTATVGGTLNRFTTVHSTPFFLDINGDGKLDFFAPRYTATYEFEFAQLLAKGDGTFDGANATVAPAQFLESMLWVTTVDLNGDGLPDALFNTPRGAVIAFADVVRR